MVNSSLSSQELGRIAARHGVKLERAGAASRAARLEELRAVLDDRTVPFPINPATAASYYNQASSGQLFGVGSLTLKTLDLGEYANTQDYDRYTLEEHLSWACLIADQQRTKSRFACKEYRDGEEKFGIGESAIPDYYVLNARIYQQTGWQLATVSEIIPAELFFTCHSLRFFPVTTFMRPLEQDYLQEPDMGHDIAGHVATFTIPTVAKVMENHGLARDLIYSQRDLDLEQTKDPIAQQAIRERADELLLYAERIYWFTVEFGLVAEESSIKAYGAGILSSPGETVYSIDSATPNRIMIDPSRDCDLMRLVTTDYAISEFQKSYFVAQSFSLLESLTPERIVAATQQAAKLPHFSWRDILPGDHVVNVGTVGLTQMEKYTLPVAGEDIDECSLRTALRNSRLFRKFAASGAHDLAENMRTKWAAPIDMPSNQLLDRFDRSVAQKSRPAPRPLSA